MTNKIQYFKCKIILALLFTLFFVWLDGSDAAEIQASSCQQEDVKVAVDMAQSGDTVKVPVGECLWPGNIVIPNSKKLAILGAGKNATVISGASFTLGRSGSRISGFGFIDGILTAEGYGFEIDNCHFEKIGNWGNAIEIWSLNTNDPLPPYGLIYSCDFANIRILSSGTNMMMADGDGTAQHDLWALPQTFGAYDTVYVEDCTFTNGHSIDGNYGGRFVFRFNTIVNGLGIEAHGGEERMIRGWEIYGNTLMDGPEFMMILLRGGTGFVFNNTLDNVNLRFTINRLTEGTNLCDGTSGWDENLGRGEEAGYACRDQIGRGHDLTQWYHNPPRAYAQPLIPAYVWSNLDGGALQTFSRVNGSEYYIRPDRDYYQQTLSFSGTSGVGVGHIANRPSTCTQGVGYWATDQGNWNKIPGGEQGILYKCVAENTWEAYYTPYTYPHPLRGEDSGGGILPAAPTGLTVR